MHLTHGRIRPAYRYQHHSMLDLDLLNNHDHSHSSPSTSTSSISYSSTRSSEKPSYNNKIINLLMHSGARIAPNDVYELRRELFDDYRSQKTAENRRNVLHQAIKYFDLLRCELNEQVQLQTNHLQFFASEYASLVSWVYSTIRFEPSISYLEKHFENMKREYEHILNALVGYDDEFLECVLRFAALCLEYSHFCDEDAISWCHSAIARTTAPRSPSAISTNSGDSLGRSSRLSDGSTSNISVCSRQTSRNRRRLADSIQTIINQLQQAMAIKAGGAREKRID